MLRDYSQIEMAKHFGVAQGSYSGWENGAEPDYDTLIRIAKFFNISLNDLLITDLNKRRNNAVALQKEKNFENLHDKVENLVKVVEALAVRVGVDIEELKD